MSLPLRRLYTAGLVLLCLIASGCSLTPTRERGEQPSLASIDHWQASGKLGVRIDGKADNAYFSWEQRGDDFTVHLYGPLGQGSVYLYKRGDIYELHSQEGDAIATSPEDLLASTTGWDLPVGNLIYWLKGLRAPDIPVVQQELDDRNRLLHLNQQGWDIHYRSYLGLKGYDLPQKISASRPGLRLIMVVKSWELDTE